jgi:bacterioferritin
MELSRDETIDLLNRIVELELAGAVRYTQYSLMVFGHAGIGQLAGTHHESVDDIMQELLVHERRGLELYRRLLDLSAGRSVSLEEFARQKIRNEEMHIAEIEKMLRRRGDA